MDINLHCNGYLHITGRQATKQFIVHSAVLVNISPVFKVMFAGDFSEGKNLSSMCAKQLALEDDDEDALELLLAYIHFRTPTFAPDARTLYFFSCLCDKYSCSSSVSDYAIASFGSPKSISGVQYKVAASWLLNYAEAFRVATEQLVVNFDVFEVHAFPDDNYLIPSKIMRLVGLQRRTVVQELGQALMAVSRSDTSNDTCSTSFLDDDRERISQYTGLICELATNSLAAVVKDLKDFFHKAKETSPIQCATHARLSDHPFHRTIPDACPVGSFNELGIKMLDTVLFTMNGLCLSCIRAGHDQKAMTCEDVHEPEAAQANK